MRVSDDRYTRDRERLDLALRLIRHEARTFTIRQWTGLSDDRIRKLYRSYVPEGAAAAVLRHRGKSPRQAAFFFRKPEAHFSRGATGEPVPRCTACVRHGCRRLGITLSCRIAGVRARCFARRTRPISSYMHRRAFLSSTPGSCCWRSRGTTRWAWPAARIAAVCACATCSPDVNRPAAIASMSCLDGHAEAVRGPTHFLLESPAIVYCASGHTISSKPPFGTARCGGDLLRLGRCSDGGEPMVTQRLPLRATPCHHCVITARRCGGARVLEANIGLCDARSCCSCLPSCPTRLAMDSPCGRASPLKRLHSASTFILAWSRLPGRVKGLRPWWADAQRRCDRCRSANISNRTLGSSSA